VSFKAPVLGLVIPSSDYLFSENHKYKLNTKMVIQFNRFKKQFTSHEEWLSSKKTYFIDKVVIGISYFI